MDPALLLLQNQPPAEVRMVEPVIVLDQAGAAHGCLAVPFGNGTRLECPDVDDADEDDQ